jgi:3-oxoacyl-[acyl-carrier protein] reductase
MDLLLRYRNVLITGSSRGLGKAIAAEFLREGARVAVTGRDGDIVDKTVREFSSAFDRSWVVPFVGDLTDAPTISSCVDVVTEAFGSIDILVANIGSGRAPVSPVSPEDEWERMMEVNFHGARRITDRVLPLMLKRKSGSIIHISSIAGLEAIGAPASYSAAKSALNVWSKTLARVVSREGVRINVVSPGNILASDGTWERKRKENPAAVEAMLDHAVPMKRFASPEEIARVVVFVASERASFMTGSCVVVDGGQTTSF